MAGGDETDVHITDAQAFAILHRRTILLAVAHLHDRQRFRSRPHRLMPAARMIGMAVGNQCPRLGPRRIDPCIGGFDVDAFQMRLDPVAQAAH